MREPGVWEFQIETLDPEKHTNTTKWGRNALRGKASEERMKEKWNQPVEGGRGRGRGGSEGG